MKRLGVILVVLLGIGGLAMLAMHRPAPAARPVAPRIIVPIQPRIEPPRKPFCPRCPQDLADGGSLAVPLAAAVGGRTSPDGVPLSVDYPGRRHLRNLEGSDGLGLCGYASNSMSMDWHNHREGRELLNWMTHRPGGAYPAKFDKDMRDFWASKNQPVPKYMHYEGKDLSVLDKAVSSGRMVAGTYYRSPTGRYGGKRIAHMVDWVHADGTRYCVLDNNFPGDAAYEWMTRDEAERTIKDGQGKMWLVIYSNPPPPPPPHNTMEVCSR